jgi:hypothetical protein
LRLGWENCSFIWCDDKKVGSAANVIHGTSRCPDCDHTRCWDCFIS